jgi:serine protease DegQ
VPSAQNGAQSTATNPRVQLQQEQASQQFGQPQAAPNSCVQNPANPGIPTSIAPVNSGTLVIGSLCGTPADTAGLLPGDVITAVNSHQVSSPVSLMAVLGTLPAGSHVKLTWVTPADHTVSRTITLAPAPPK